MPYTSSILLYVADPEASAVFYARLFGQEPLDASPGFAIFGLPTGLGLGLWKRANAVPAPEAGGGGCEIGFKVASPEAVDGMHADWVEKGAAIAMPPTELDFGRCFLALDPDGHRLRVYEVSR